MNVTVHIERLVLDGLPVEPAAVPALRRAVQAEIARLLAAGALPPGLLAPAAVPSLRAPVPTAPPDGSAASWGVHIGRAVYGSFGR